MKITHSHEIEKAISKLLETMNLNEANADAFNIYLKARDEMMFSSCEKAYKKHGNPKASFLSESKKYLMNLGDYDFINESSNNISVLDPKEYENDPYWKSIHFPSSTLGNWKLASSSYAPFEGMLSDEIIVKENDYYKEINQLGFFLKGFRYIEVIQNKKTWMSITPHEINTMKAPIAEAKGKVITFGLGLGYYPFSVSLKKDVESVTVIEKDKNCIELFNKFILPQFEFKSKINIVEADAYEFAKNMKDGSYSYSFVDIWRLPFDGLFSYLRFVPYFVSFKETKTSYWIEKSILSLLRRALLILIDEEYNGSSDEDYRKSANETDALINALHFCLKEREIASSHDLMLLLSDDSLRSLAAQKLIK